MKKLGAGEEFEVREHRSIVLDARLPAQPILGLWIKTMPDATYLVLGQFHHRTEIEFPERRDGSWFPLVELKNQLPAAWPPGSKPGQHALVVMAVNLVEGSVRIQLGNDYRLSR